MPATLVTRNELDSSAKIPAGTIFDYAGTTVPSGWLACDGSNVSRTTYADLFAAIGTTWGVGDGSTTFAVPDLRRRTTIGSGGTGTATVGNAVGNTGGAETHTLTTAEMPSHTHGAYHNSTAPYKVPSPGSGAEVALDGVTYNFNQATTATGGGGAHNNMQPSAVVAKMIKT